MIPEQLALLLIEQKNHNKRFGEFEYFGGSDVANRLLVLISYPNSAGCPKLEVWKMQKYQLYCDFKLVLVTLWLRQKQNPHKPQFMTQSLTESYKSRSSTKKNLCCNQCQFTLLLSLLCTQQSEIFSEDSFLKVSFFVMSEQCIKINQNFKILLSY